MKKLMEKKILFFATSATYKFEAAKAILGDLFDLIQMDIGIAEYQSKLISEVAQSKAIAAYARCRGAVIVDDGGIELEAYNGWPGALAKYAKRDLGMTGVLKLMNGITDRRAISVSSIAYCDADLFAIRNPLVFTSRQPGSIVDFSPDYTSFDKNDGFDHIFIPKGADSVFALMSKDDQQRFSERRKALSAFRAWAEAILK